MEAQHDGPHAPAAPATGGNAFIKRELNGSTFLTLEHIGHMALVVIIPMLILMGLYSAFSMWTGSAGIASAVLSTSPLVAASGFKMVEAVVALFVVAALLVLVPTLVILDRRTRAEWHKRAGYASRLAYKVPLYTAIGVLVASMVVVKIELIYIILTSLAFIGVPGSLIGSMYLQGFLPLILVQVVLAAATWYLFKLAKGQDNGRMFSMIAAGVSLITVVALFITSLTVLHSTSNVVQPGSSGSSSKSDSIYNSQYYQDLLNKYNQ